MQAEVPANSSPQQLMTVQAREESEMCFEKQELEV